jgi:hypothetical protein
MKIFISGGSLELGPFHFRSLVASTLIDSTSTDYWGAPYALTITFLGPYYITTLWYLLTTEPLG